MTNTYRVKFEYNSERKHIDFWIEKEPDKFAIKESAIYEIKKAGYLIEKCSNISDPEKIN